MDVTDAKSIVKTILGEIIDDTTEFYDDMPLIGSDSNLDSMKLVELCLALEDKATSANFEFDWTSSSIFSKSRSMFKTISTLAEEFAKQAQNCK